MLGDEWEPMGDGTYRFVGERERMPELPRLDRLAAHEESTPRDETKRLAG
jgi:hypothetical protein